MDKNTQLPAEVLKNIKDEANKIYWETHSASRHRDPYCMGLTMFEVAQIPLINALTEYAAKLHKAEQGNERLKGELDVAIRANENLTSRMASWQQQLHKVQKDRDAARALLEKVTSRHEAGLLPDRLLYNEIKTFLDGTK